MKRCLSIYTIMKIGKTNALFNPLATIIALEVEGNGLEKTKGVIGVIALLYLHETGEICDIKIADN